WAARESLRLPLAPAGPAPGPVAGPVAATKVKVAHHDGEVAQPQPDAGSMPPVEAHPAPEPAGKAETPQAAAPQKAKPGPPAPPPTAPAGVAGLAEKSDGILLRYSEDRREWERLDKEIPLKTSDRILCLEPFRAAIDVGKVRIRLIHETEVRILSKPSDAAPTIELVQGKIVVRQPGSDALKVVFAKQPVTLELATDSIVGLERVSLTKYGQPVTQPASLGVLCQQGEVTLVVGAKRETMKPMSAALVD